MGIITLAKADHLFWLGRYTERVYTTIREFFIGYDRMIDENEDSYQEFCQRLNIPDVYGAKEIFLMKYPFDAENPDSIVSNLLRAYDNALVMRDEIGTETLSYIQLAIYELKKASVSTAPLIEMQNVLDNLLAFIGSVDDFIDDEQNRSIIKAGRRVERLDLYLRFEMPLPAIDRELVKLRRRMPRTGLRYNHHTLSALPDIIDDCHDYPAAVNMLENILQ